MKELLDLDADTRQRGRGDPAHPGRAGGPALQRRHRHLREGVGRGRRRRGRPRQRPRARGRQGGAGARGGARAATWASPSAAALEYWAQGGPLNTDAVDNSGGVDMSDHEVNIKILIDLLVKKGALEGPRGAQPHPGRDDRGGGRPGARRQRQPGAGPHPRRAAQRRALRGVRGLHRGHGRRGRPEPRRRRDPHPRRSCWRAPSSERGLPRPLLAVLLGHTKMWAFETALETELPGQPRRPPLPRRATSPERLQRVRRPLRRAPLRREIVATAAVNHLVNNAGITFLSRVMAAAEDGHRRGRGRLPRGRPPGRRERPARSRGGRGPGRRGGERAAARDRRRAGDDGRDRLTTGRADGAAALEPVRARLAGTATAAKRRGRST